MGHSWKYLKASAWGMTVGMDNWEGEEVKIIRICFLSRSDIHTCSVLCLMERSKSIGNKSDFDLRCVMHVGFLFPSKEFKHCGVGEKSMA